MDPQAMTLKHLERVMANFLQVQEDGSQKTPSNGVVCAFLLKKMNLVFVDSRMWLMLSLLSFGGTTSPQTPFGLHTCKGVSSSEMEECRDLVKFGAKCCQFMELALSLILKIVKFGDFSFWKDNWLENRTISRDRDNFTYPNIKLIQLYNNDEGWLLSSILGFLWAAEI
ncbi:hypothetical protein ACH5RR_033756 [Cinchona calisaya]|uniref:Uncharacterized protein n=1 Tax=Cinchona calisaya TaxID=153742 RepID=A0ABD2Y9V4_9GENT